MIQETSLTNEKNKATCDTELSLNMDQIQDSLHVEPRLTD